MPVLPGAEPFAADGHGALARTGALLIHGFTGCPQSMRPWAQYLAAAGLTTSCPRLPGHGTRWQDLNATQWPDWFAAVSGALDALAAKCDRVVVLGLSMGGTLALRLAEVRPAAVAGLVLVNPSLTSEKRALPLLGLLKWILPSLPGIGSDIKAPGVRELAYARMPVRALASLVDLWGVTRAELAAVRAPILLLRSATDHVVEPVNARLLLEGVSSTDVTERVLPESYHVATLDNDRETIFAESLAFARRLAAPAPTAGQP